MYSSPNIIRNLKSRRQRWAGHVASMEQYRNAYRVLVGKPEGKRPLRKVDCDVRYWIDLVGDRDQWRAYARR